MGRIGAKAEQQNGSYPESGAKGLCHLSRYAGFTLYNKRKE
jgi:hypothetical protein